MLKELTIDNLVLMEKCRLNLKSGLVAITGESGAGKSVLLSALKLLSGQKASQQLIRKGAEKASVEAVFEVALSGPWAVKCADLEIDFDGELIVQREILSNGKSRSRINGAVVSLNDLQEICGEIVQLHGQSEQTLLKDVRTHLSIVDHYCPDQTALLEYKSQYKEYALAKKEIQNFDAKFKQILEQEEFIRFQFAELQKAALIPCEDDELKQKLEGLNQSGEIQQLLNDSISLLSEGKPNLQNLLVQFQKKIESLCEFKPELEVVADSVNQVRDLFSDIERSLGKVEIVAEISPVELDKMNGRLAMLQRLMRKYHLSLDGLIELKDKREKEIYSIENSASELEFLKLKLQKQEENLKLYSKTLTEVRSQFAKELSGKIVKVLHDLGMVGAQFEIQFENADFGPEGADSVELWASANKGEALKPLKNTLSGGELSRIMLALKSAMADRDLTPILVFDEVDSGISGETGNKIGECLKILSQNHQVFTITHLQQVASQAQSQVLVQKTVTGENTQSFASVLDTEQRVVELARMMGNSNSQEIREHARKLLLDFGSHA